MSKPASLLAILPKPSRDLRAVLRRAKHSIERRSAAFA